IDDGMLVLGAAPGMDAGLRAQRAALHDRCLARPDRVLVEIGRGQIPMDRSQILEAKFIGAIGAVAKTGFLHESLHDAPGPTPDLDSPEVPLTGTAKP